MLSALLARALIPAVSARERIAKGDVVVIPVRGEIGPSLYLFLRRGIKLAEANSASAIILQLDTYGGRLDSAENIAQALVRTDVPTYTFVDANAGSAGAMIALATKHIYMAPVSAIGAAAPILSNGEDLPATARDKTVSYFSALVRGMATRNGHNPDIGEAFINKDKEVKIGDRMLHAKGSLLTLSAQEATENINGKPVLADGIAQSIDELAQKANLRGHVVTIAPTGFEHLAFWLTSLAPLLLLGGIVLAYLEFKLPGVTLPGVLAAICFALFFVGHYLAGLAGWEAVILFAFGLALVLVEVLFFGHSTIVFGVVGALMMIASLLWAMVDHYPDGPLLPTTQQLQRPLLNLSFAVVVSIFVIVWLSHYLPRTSFYRRFALLTATPAGPSFDSGGREFAMRAALAAGTRGLAVTPLRPSGKAAFERDVIDVVTAGEFVPPHTPVVVSQVDGMRVVVRAAS